MWRKLFLAFLFCVLSSVTAHAEGTSMSFTDFQAVVAGDDSVSNEFVEAETRDGVRYVKLLADVAWVDTDTTNSIFIGSDDGTPRFVELDLNGHEINANQAGSVIDIRRNSTLTIDDSVGVGKITGGDAKSEVGGQDAQLPNGTGGGVRVQKGTHFILNNGVITGNTAKWGAGVELQPESDFIMNGGSISGNTASEESGGVNMDSPSEFTMNDGEISDNYSATIAGGVRVANGCKFTMNYGVINGNSVGTNGGGVWDNGEFTFLTGEITNNTANNGMGGGICVVDKGLTIRVGTDSDAPAEISGNNAASGGGISFNHGDQLVKTYFHVGANSELWGNTRGNSGVDNAIFMSYELTLVLDKGAADKMMDSDFWLYNFLNTGVHGVHFNRPVYIIYPESDMGVLSEHLMSDAFDASHIMTKLFDYDTDGVGGTYWDTKWGSGVTWPDVGINEGHALKFGSDPLENGTLYNGKGIVKPLLGDDGFPVLDLPDSNESLAYLFNDETSEYKRAYQPTNTIFQEDGEWYVFDSQRWYAEYDETGNRFDVYDTPAIWSHDNYWYGQMFPFNKLRDMVYVHDGKVDPKYVASRIRQDGIYLNHYFGMKVDVDFMQTRDGMVFNHATNQRENVRFEFSGDDDVWVFMDGVLVLDIGGTHGKCAGYIDFATGEVSSPDNNMNNVLAYNELYTSGTIKDLFKLAQGDSFDEALFEGDTFKSGSSHTLTMFYMERGNWVSNFSARFNLHEQPLMYLKKIDGASGEPLAGAKFKLYDDMDCTVEHEGAASEFISNNDGYVVLDAATVYSLGAGSYWLKETEVPEGYVLDDTARWELVVKEDRSYELRDLNGDKVDGMANWPERTRVEMPETGGLGIWWFLIVGFGMLSLGLAAWRCCSR